MRKKDGGCLHDKQSSSTKTRLHVTVQVASSWCPAVHMKMASGQTLDRTREKACQRFGVLARFGNFDRTVELQEILPAPFCWLQATSLPLSFPSELCKACACSTTLQIRVWQGLQILHLKHRERKSNSENQAGPDEGSTASSIPLRTFRGVENDISFRVTAGSVCVFLFIVRQNLTSVLSLR